MVSLCSGYNNLNVIKLSHLKLTDTGVMYLLRHPLQKFGRSRFIIHCSHNYIVKQIRTKSVTLNNDDLILPILDAPNIKILNIESTKVRKEYKITVLHSFFKGIKY